MSPLVCCKTPGKPNCQRTLIERRYDRFQDTERSVASCVLLDQLLAAGTNQPGSVHFMAAPQLLIVDLVNASDVIGFSGTQIPFGSQISVEKIGKFLGNK